MVVSDMSNITIVVSDICNLIADEKGPIKTASLGNDCSI